jgi:hypothetical protein
MDLPNGEPVIVEVDTGSDMLILNESHAGGAGVDLRGDKVRKVTGTDETGNEFVRYFTDLPGDVRVSGETSSSGTSPRPTIWRGHE